MKYTINNLVRAHGSAHLWSTWAEQERARSERGAREEPPGTQIKPGPEVQTGSDSAEAKRWLTVGNVG